MGNNTCKSMGRVLYTFQNDDTPFHIRETNVHINTFSAGAVNRCQNMTSTDVRF